MKILRSSNRLGVALLFGATGLLPQLAAAAPPRAGAPLTPIEGEVIVGFKPEASVTRRHVLTARAAGATVRQALDDRAASLGQRIGRPLRAGAAVGADTQVVRASGVSAAALAATLATDPDVAFAVPNGRSRILTAPNDPLYPATAPGVRRNGPDSGQWYLRAPTSEVRSGIDIERAWAITLGNPSVVVAVLDTGVRPEHPDLRNRLLPGYNFVADPAVSNNGGSGRIPDATDPGDWTTAAENSNPSGKFHKCDPAGTGEAVATDSSWHGTQTASLVGASTNDAIGMAGAAPGVRVLPVRVLGKCFGSDADIQAGMLWAAGIPVPGVPDNPNPARVLNLSLGGGSSCNAAYQAVVDRITAVGAVVVAAAGNSTGAAVSSPGNCRGVISVLALRHAGTKVGFSDLGPEISIAAPGGNCVNITAGSPCLYPILTATNTGRTVPLASAYTDSYDVSVGTSFASPLVAGVAGLMISAQPLLTPAQVRERMQSSARPFPTSGADNGGDATPVPQCVAPSSNVEQLQCYCTTGLCGAGMLDAGAAVAAAAAVVPRIDVADPATPVAGAAITLSAGGSQTVAGASIVSYAWAIVDGGGIVGAFSSATNAATATLTPSAAGSFSVRLTLVDNLGNSGSVTQTVVVAATTPVVPTPAPTPTPAGSSGGGGFSAAWLAGLAVAAWALRRSAPAAGG